MRPKVVMRRLGSLSKLLAVLLIVPGAVAAYYGETRGVIAFSLTAFITLAFGIILERLGSDDEMGIKEGFALVAFGWLGAAFFGALPYFFLGITLLDGLFECMSGFTTTGSSILTESNAQGYWIINQTLAEKSIAANLAHGLTRLLVSTDQTGSNIYAILNISREQTFYGLLFWRSFSQWLGGMGIILLFIAILPKLGVAGRQLYKAEVPGPDKESITPRIRETAKLLWWIYVLMTVAEVSLLVLAGMPLYDSICNTFATMATGGFSPQSLSIAAYNSALIDAIVTLFMFLAGANFVLHYRVLYVDRTSLFHDSEFKFYAFLLLLATTIIVFWGGVEGDLLFKIRMASFQAVSMMTTTGFATTDFDLWTAVAKIVLFFLMFIGACAGSTGGAIKVVRILLVMKSWYRELIYALHPKAVISVRLGGVPVKEEILRSSNIFIALYILIFAVASLMLGIVSADDVSMDFASITSAVATTLGNVGPGFGSVGPMFSFQHIDPLGKMILFFCMWIGRLEIITALVLLVPEFWKK
ncbi:MAG: TrkH family potassium uptake protein [Methanotrichaceae archaeon]|nr:TrkH family potassium uptake protein [Methanotrichaceae archaeon]